MVRFVKLNEYLEKNQYSIAKAIADALNLNTKNIDDIKYVISLFDKVSDSLVTPSEKQRFEMELISALENEDNEKVRELLNVDDEDLWENVFNGIDLAEGFDFHCSLHQEAPRNNMMDWLEEQGIDYLIDNYGNFAIKCPDRNTQYRVNRKLQHIKNKWNYRNTDMVDIDASAPKSLKPVLADHENLVEYTPRYPDNIDGVYRFLKNNLKDVSNIDFYKFKPDPVKPYIWLVLDILNKKAFIVYLDKNEFEEIDFKHAKRRHFDMFEGKKGIKKLIKKGKDAKKELDDPVTVARLAAGGNPLASEVNTNPMYKPKVDARNKKKELSKKMARQKVKVTEGVLGMTGMPTLAVDRLKQLAGIIPSTQNNSKTITITTELEPEVNVIESGLNKAFEHVDEAFKIVDCLTQEEKDKFKLELLKKLGKE